MHRALRHSCVVTVLQVDWVLHESRWKEPEVSVQLQRSNGRRSGQRLLAVEAQASLFFDVLLSHFPLLFGREQLVIYWQFVIHLQK